ncbi:MAG: hypothetical protein WAX66_02950 [Patescibacteria group bacterium]
MRKILSSVYTFILIGILFLGCSFWIYKNIKVEDLVGSASIPSNVSKDAAVGKIDNELKLEVRDNNIVKVVSPDSVELVLSGSKIENFESFSDISISPDKKKICFIVHTITPMWLYVSNIDGSNLEKVDLGKNCVWSPDSKYIAYNNHTTDVSPVNINLYILSTDETKNLIGSYVKNGFMRVYSKPEWISGSIIEASYSEFPYSNVQDQTFGKSSINIESGKIVDY